MSEQAPSSTLEHLMEELRHGSREAANELVARIYPELRRIAATRMKGERTDHTWQPTALVNELYIELTKLKSIGPAGAAQHDKEEFCRFAAHIMRRLLIQHSRPMYRRAQKVEIVDLPDAARNGPTELDQVEGLLTELALLNPQLRIVVEMKVFEGFSVTEIAEALDCSERTVARHWNFAKRYLQTQFALD